MTTKTAMQVNPRANFLFSFDPALVDDPPDPFTGFPFHGWTQQSDNLGAIPTNMFVMSNTDDPPFSRPCMQDRYRTFVDGSWNTKSQQGVIMSVFPWQNTRYYAYGVSPHDCISMGDHDVMQRLVDDVTGIPWRPETDLLGGSEAMYNRLEQSPIETNMKHMKDPLESEFSVWYLLHDLQQTPTLLKGIYKSIHRIRSMMGRDGILRDLVNKHTMKELASLRLAHAYGIQPTISDIHELVDAIFKWYSTWVKKTHKFGTLRTYHNRKILGDKKNPEVFKRLRFETYGGGISHANLKRTDGPLILNQTVKFYFVAPELTNKMQALKSLIDTSGILDPAALWDRVPFSFAIDWFIDITSVLHRMKPKQLPVDMVIADWAESLSRQTIMDLSLDYLGTTTLHTECIPTSERFASIRVWQTARKRQFPSPLHVEPKSILGKGLTLRRTINGSCVIFGITVAEGPKKKEGSNYRKRQPKKLL